MINVIKYAKTLSALLVGSVLATSGVLLSASASSEATAQGVSGKAPTRNFDRGTGTGEPSAETARLLELMKGADDAFNARDYDFFIGKRHVDDVKVLLFGKGETTGRAVHRADIEKLVATFPDLRVHNDPYDVQFGQGQWTVAIGKMSGTFTKPMVTPDGKTIQPTGKRFETFFTTIAKWNGDEVAEEYVMYDMNDLNRQIMP